MGVNRRKFKAEISLSNDTHVNMRIIVLNRAEAQNLI